MAEEGKTEQASLEDKTLDEVYLQRGEMMLLAMAFAKKAGCKVGVRGDDDWPVHVIDLPGYGEVALHMKASDAEACVLKVKYDGEYDGHTNQDKSARIRGFVQEVFGGHS